MTADGPQTLSLNTRSAQGKVVVVRLTVDDYPRAFVFHVEAWDANCPQHINPRYTREELESLARREEH